MGRVCISGVIVFEAGQGKLARMLFEWFCIGVSVLCILRMSIMPLKSAFACTCTSKLDAEFELLLSMNLYSKFVTSLCAQCKPYPLVI